MVLLHVFFKYFYIIKWYMNEKCCFAYCGNICTVFYACLQLQIPFAGKFLRRSLKKTLLAFIIHHHMLH